MNTYVWDKWIKDNIFSAVVVHPIVTNPNTFRDMWLGVCRIMPTSLICKIHNHYTYWWTHTTRHITNIYTLPPFSHYICIHCLPKKALVLISIKTDAPMYSPTRLEPSTSITDREFIYCRHNTNHAIWYCYNIYMR